MTMGNSTARVGVYVDVANINRNGGYGMGYEVLREFACRDNAEAVRLNAYVSFDAEKARRDSYYRNRTNSFYSVLRDFGYKVIQKEVKWFTDEDGNRVAKANADLDLAVDALLQSENLDRVLLVTGDGDFVQVVRALQNKGCRVEVVAFKNVSSELRREADMFMSDGSRQAWSPPAPARRPKRRSRHGLQRLQHRPQRRWVAARRHADHSPAELDLNWRRSDHDRGEAQSFFGHHGTAARLPTPAEQLRRRQPVTARHRAHRLEATETLGYDSRLLLGTPRPAPPGAREDLQPTHRLRHRLTHCVRHRSNPADPTVGRSLRPSRHRNVAPRHRLRRIGIPTRTCSASSSPCPACRACRSLSMKAWRQPGMPCRRAAFVWPS